MRLAIAIAAFGLVLGAPIVAPTSFMNQAEAQTKIGYVNGPTTVRQLGGNNQQTGGQQAGGQQTGSTQTPVVRRTVTRRTIVPPRPRIPTTPIIPVIVEPNPSQAGSPT